MGLETETMTGALIVFAALVVGAAVLGYRDER